MYDSNVEMNEAAFTRYCIKDYVIMVPKNQARTNLERLGGLAERRSHEEEVGGTTSCCEQNDDEDDDHGSAAS